MSLVKIQDKRKDIQVGFITYDLQEFTADCLSRVAKALPYKLKAYPVFERIAKDRIDFSYRPSVLKGRFFSVRKDGSTPEGLTSSINWSAAWECVRDSGVVVLFGIQGGTALLATFLATIMRRKLISVNQTLPPEFEKRRRWWVRWVKGWILRRCHIHVIQTPVSRETLSQVYRIPDELFVDAPFESGASTFIELFSEISEDRVELRRMSGWAEEECIFIFAGTLLRFKGIETIIEASALLKNTYHNFRVVCIGPAALQPGEPSIEDYQKHAREAGVEGIVIFTGKRSFKVLAKAYLAADVLMLPTQKDCWPKVFVEGALAGLPLITTSACGAAGSLVLDGKTGIVILPDDSDALAEAMQKMLDPVFRQPMGKKAREVCLEFCDPVKETAGFVEAVRKAVETR